jgi:hypothetical protein
METSFERIKNRVNFIRFRTRKQYSTLATGLLYRKSNNVAALKVSKDYRWIQYFLYVFVVLTMPRPNNLSYFREIHVKFYDGPLGTK